MEDKISIQDVKRCGWASSVADYYKKYHDEEWGEPVHDDIAHFELIILEGAQAGLSWDTILRKRENYRKSFHNFDPKLVSKMSDNDLESLMQNEGIVRNRLKIYSARQNALAFLEIQEEFGSFDNYIWPFVGGNPILNKHESMKTMPSKTEISDKISKDLKKRGMNFVGSTIIYAYMQAAGLVNDHTKECFKFK